jgi:hemerythrin
MKIPPWSNEYSVHSIEIDDQHRKLFRLVNNLDEAVQRGKGPRVLGPTLDALVEYAREHFADEEALLERIHYPALDEHRLEHASFSRQLTSLQVRYHTGQASLSTQVLEFLEQWLEKHVLQSDQKYAAYIQDTQQSPDPGDYL